MVEGITIFLLKFGLIIYLPHYDQFHLKLTRYQYRRRPSKCVQGRKLGTQGWVARSPTQTLILIMAHILPGWLVLTLRAGCVTWCWSETCVRALSSVFGHPIYRRLIMLGANRVGAAVVLVLVLVGIMVVVVG